VPDPTSTDAKLSDSQRAALSALLDTLVPANAALEMPSAADVDFDHHLRTQANDFVPVLVTVLKQLEAGFADLSPGERAEHVSALGSRDPGAFAQLLTHVYDAYYQDDRVREKIGMVKGPVFPQGNELVSGDLSLLDPVRENADKYRYRAP